jgi:hypothetical protein
MPSIVHPSSSEFPQVRRGDEKPCKIIFRPFLTIFDHLSGRPESRFAARLKHSAIFADHVANKKW